MKTKYTIGQEALIKISGGHTYLTYVEEIIYGRQVRYKMDGYSKPVPATELMEVHS